MKVGDAETLRELFVYVAVVCPQNVIVRRSFREGPLFRGPSKRVSGCQLVYRFRHLARPTIVRVLDGPNPVSGAETHWVAVTLPGQGVRRRTTCGLGW